MALGVLPEQLKVQVELGLEDSELHYPRTKPKQEQMEEVRVKTLLPLVPVVEAQELVGIQGMEAVEGRSVKECQLLLHREREVEAEALRPPVPVVEAQGLEVEPQVLEAVQGMELVEGRSVQECQLLLHREREVEAEALQPPVPVGEAQELEVEPQVLEGVQGMELVEGRSVRESLFFLP
jgi:hypothetical protein